jgi:AcrR family transcriptional regulator
MTRGVIHNHFGSSNGLISAVVEVGFTELTSAMGALRLPSGAPRDSVRALVDTAWAAFSSPT